MIARDRKILRRLAWFITGLAGCLLLTAATLPFDFQARQTAAPPSAGKVVAMQVIGSGTPLFNEVAATHLEPNFYQ